MARSLLAISAIAVFLCGSATAQDNPLEQSLSLNLLCYGGGSANKMRSGSASVWNNYGDSANATTTHMEAQGFEDQADVRIAGEEGQIRMPRAMLPLLRGGKDGWFTLKNIRVSEAEILASVSVNPINNPKLRIDRFTGTINISGKAGDYVGRCRAYDPAQVERQF